MSGAILDGVLCPVCHSVDTKVVDSRSADGGLAIRRRRECVDCHRRFSTFERVEEAPLVVVKRSGGHEPFDPAKITGGLLAACKGRPLSTADFDRLASEVEEAARGLGSEVSSEWVGLAVLERLGQLDQVAYLRFASVYKSFDGIDDFEREARLIKVDPSDAGSPA
jgi:transcriptional repressor NrdR